MSLRQQADFVPQKLVKDNYDPELKDKLESLVRNEVERQLQPLLARIEQLEAAIGDGAD